jgi:hypothetical protein
MEQAGAAFARQPSTLIIWSNTTTLLKTTCGTEVLWRNVSGEEKTKWDGCIKLLLRWNPRD